MGMVVDTGKELVVRSWLAGQSHGLRAAVPDAGGKLDREGLTAGTSAATALATRAAHRIFDALMDDENGAILKGVDEEYCGVVVKALLAHSARWGKKGELLEDLYGLKGTGKHVERKDNIARVLGYGLPHVEEAIRCEASRAVLIGYGEVSADGSAELYEVPLPPNLENVKEPRSITITLAWFSPVNVRHQAYRRSKLEVQPIELDKHAGVGRVRNQPSDKSVPRGSLFHVRYCGDRAVPFVQNGYIQFRVFCRASAGKFDGAIRYGLAVTIEAGEGVPVYQEIDQRLGIRPRP